MPTYIFNCTQCKHHFEKFCYMSDLKGLKPDCPQCNSLEVERDFKSERAGGFVGPQTVGMLAEKNSRKSSDELASINKRNYEYLKKGREVEPPK